MKSQNTGADRLGRVTSSQSRMGLPMCGMIRAAPMSTVTTAVPSASRVSGARQVAPVSRRIAETTAPP